MVLGEKRGRGSRRTGGVDDGRERVQPDTGGAEHLGMMVERRK